MYGAPNTFCNLRTATAVSEANTLKSITVTPSANQRIVVIGATAGYKGNGDGWCHFQYGSTDLFHGYIVGPNPLKLCTGEGLYQNVGASLVLSIGPGGLGICGYLSLEYYIVYRGPDKRWVSTPQCHVPAANTEATLTLAAATGVTHVLTTLLASYDGAPAAAKELSVTVGATKRFSTWISAAGAYPFTFEEGLYGAATGNEAMVISLPASGDAGVKGSISIITH